MKHLKRYNESIEEDEFFSNEFVKTLKDILVEYTDIDMTYSINLKLFKDYQGYYMPMATDHEPFEFEKFKKNNPKLNDTDAYKGYQISFPELIDDDGMSATDIQRGDNQRFFGLPTDKIYKFFEITKDVQHTIESMGYTFLLSTHKYGEFDLMIIEKK